MAEVFSGKAIEHLASGEHWKRVKGFMWKYGGGMDRVDLFRIAEGDFAKVIVKDATSARCMLGSICTYFKLVAMAKFRVLSSVNSWSLA